MSDVIDIIQPMAITPESLRPLIALFHKYFLCTTPPTLEQIEEIEGEMLKLPQEEIPTTHHFAPGVYIREAIMPKGSFIIGHQHKHEHFNLLSRGKVSVFMNGKVHQLNAPYLIKSDAGVRKMFFMHEESSWSTIHATDETDIDKLEDKLFVKSETYQRLMKGKLSPCQQ